MEKWHSKAQRQELAKFIREAGRTSHDDSAFCAQLAMRLCGSISATHLGIADAIANELEIMPYNASESVRVSIWDIDDTDSVAVSGKTLKELYELGVSRGAYDDCIPKQMKTRIDCEVLGSVATDGLD